MATAHSEKQDNSAHKHPNNSGDSPTLPTSHPKSKENVANTTESTAAVANGVPQQRASPSPNLPNGKPSSPYVKESNPMGSGAAQTVSSKDPKAAAAAASDMRNVVRRKLTGYVGFANLPNQWHRKSVRKGFNFNVMVVGKNKTIYARTRINANQVNLGLESLHWSTPCSIPLSILHANAKAQASISFLRLFPSNRSAPILRRTECV